MNNNSELHLFILWENALCKKDEILAEIKEKFEIIKIYKIKWSDEYFLKNLTRFYERNIEDCKAKAAHCGTGEFLLIIVKAQNSIYEERDASQGRRILNTNVFDCKMKFREMTGGGYKVHATNDEIETNHDITLLLNISAKDFLKQNTEKWDGQIEEIQKDLFGYNGWSNVQEMFYALNNCTNYAILRNYEGLPEEIYVNEHNDIDLICESKESCAHILNAEKVFPEEYRIHYRAKVQDKYANFDLRYLGDNYYSEKLEKNLLKNRVLNEKGFYTLNPEDYYYTLLYHAIIHKSIFKPDYKTRLIKMKENKISENSSLDDMIQILKEWLKENKYLITIPNDRSVDFNIKNANKFRPLVETESQNKNLEEFNANIIKWYPFEKDTKIMLIGENEEIEKHLNTITEKLTVISRFENISENIEKNAFDYILIYGIEQYDNIIQTLADYLSEYGKLLIIGNNSFGIKNWCKYNNNTAINMLENCYMKNTNIKKVKEQLNANKIKNTNVFYAFPNYQEAELIVNEKFDLQKSHIEKYNPDITKNEIKTFDEIKVLKNIVENKPEELEIFANSFLIEASKEQIQTNIKYISYNNCRNEKFRLITIIKDDVVEKIPANKESVQQIEQMKKTINNIKENNINLLDYEENGIIYSKLIKNQKTLDEYLNQNYNNLDNVIETLNKMKDSLLKNTLKYKECKDKVDLKGEDKKIAQDLHFMKNGYWDMIAKNCFYIDNEFIFFDQEWEKEYLPVEFLIYRSIINSYDLVRRINVDELLQKLDLLQYKQYFEKIDEDIRKEIINEKLFKEMYCKEIKGIDNLINDNNVYKRYINELKENIIEPLQEDNRKKQEYILALEEKNRINEEKLRKIFFWKR